jgi:hypothetical protein
LRKQRRKRKRSDHRTVGDTMLLTISGFIGYFSRLSAREVGVKTKTDVVSVKQRARGWGRADCDGWWWVGGRGKPLRSRRVERYGNGEKASSPKSRGEDEAHRRSFPKRKDRVSGLPGDVAAESSGGIERSCVCRQRRSSSLARSRLFVPASLVDFGRSRDEQ